MKRVYSGIQPTGGLHLGNYFGAVQNWKRLMDLNHPCTFSLVDLHALSSQNPDSLVRLGDRTRECAAMLIACGIDPERCLLYRQSSVIEHTALMWVMSPLAGANRLSRMTQFKDKAGNSDPHLALFGYPVLQAADVLLFNAQLIPVGDDQKQHIELARDLIMQLAKKTRLKLPVPSGSYTHAPRLKSLSDPSSKMSKSSTSQNGVLFLTDSDDAIAKKIRRAVTDSEPGISWEPERRLGVSSLLLLDGLVRGEKTAAASVERYKNSNKSEMKAQLTEAVIEMMRPIRTHYEELMKDPDHLERVLAKGDAKAKKVAVKNYNRIWQRVNSLK